MLRDGILSVAFLCCLSFQRRNIRIIPTTDCYYYYYCCCYSLLCILF